MMKFIIQTINGKVTLDFCFELERAQEYWNWRKEPFSITYMSLEELQAKRDIIGLDWIPVGTIEFVKVFSGIDIKPINIPTPLFDNDTWTGGAWVGKVADLPEKFKSTTPLYVKSTLFLKNSINGVVTDLSTLDPNQDYQFRLPLNILSEWRCFVWGGEVIACQPYSGDPFVFPEPSKIKRAIRISGLTCPALTMDFAVIKNKEGARLLNVLKDDSYKIILAIDGKNLSSPELADKIDKIGLSGKSHIQFVIGGSLGLSDDVIKKADMKLSFGRMTFPHQLMRVILLEQIYRSYRIISNEPYHK